MKSFASSLRSELTENLCARLGASLFLVLTSFSFLQRANAQTSNPVTSLRSEASWRYELSHRAIFGIPFPIQREDSQDPYSSLNMSRFRAAENFAQTRGALIDETKSVPFVGILDVGRDGLSGVLAMVLQQLHVQSGLVVLQEDLSRYPLLLLGSVEDLPESAWSQIESYVSNGGVLLTSMSDGLVSKAMWEHWDDPLWQRTYSFLGFHVTANSIAGANGYLQLEPTVRKITADRGCLIKGPFWEVLAPEAEKLGKLVLPWQNMSFGFAYMQAPPNQENVSPGITSSPFGKGKVVFVTLPIFCALRSTAFPCIQDSLFDLIAYLLPDPPYRVEAPPNLEANLMSKPGTLFLNLLYYDANRPLTTRLDIEECYPFRNLSVRIHASNKPTRVTLKPEGVPLEFEYSKGYVKVIVPSVKDWQILELSLPNNS